MIFLQTLGKCEYSSYTCFEFSYHDKYLIDNNDSVRSDEHHVWVADYTTRAELKTLFKYVSNVDEFKRALTASGFNIPVVCGCGKGYASPVDNLCKFCREHTVSRAEARKMGVRHRGDGLPLQDKIL